MKMLELKHYGWSAGFWVPKELLSPREEELICKAHHRAPHFGGVMPQL